MDNYGNHATLSLIYKMETHLASAPASRTQDCAFFFEQQLKIMLLLWTYGPGSSIGPELLGREEEVASGHGDGTGGRSTRKRNSES